MKAAVQVRVVFSPVFRAYFHCQEHSLTLAKEDPTLIDLLQRLSGESAGKIDPLIFDGDSSSVSAALMVQVNDTVYTGTLLNRAPVRLKDRDIVSLLYYVSGG